MGAQDSDIVVHPVDEEAQGSNEHVTASGRVLNRNWKAFFNVICAGVALMSDGYQNNLMTANNLVFAAKYPEVYNSTMSTRVSNSLLIGEVIGMIVIGLSCDLLGRKAAIALTTSCMVIGGILATAAHGTTTTGMFWMIIVMRGVVGFGSGGEYPASSTSASEAANETVKRRGGTFVLVTNLPLSLGGPFCIIVFLIVWEAASGYQNLNTVWRVTFGIGCIWPLAIFIFRWRMSVTKLYKKSAFNNRAIPWLLVFKFYWRRLIGTCGAWFLYDFITFPNGIFSGTIINSLLKGEKNIERTVEWQLLLGIIAIPGVFVGAWLCDRIGRKWTMLIGFSGYLVFGLVIGIAYEPLSKILGLFIVFYGLFNSFGNLGPGNMLGLVSSESYATGVRGSLYGLSAAVGKAGAAVGTQVFKPIQNHLGKRYTFIIAACIGVLGMLVTYFFIPHLREDDLMMEDVRFAEFLRANGYTGSIGYMGETIDDEIGDNMSVSGTSDNEKQHDLKTVSAEVSSVKSISS